MYDFIKILTLQQKEIIRLEKFALHVLQKDKPLNNNYISYYSKSEKVRLHFRKSMYKGKLVGFHHVEICLSPHYYSNEYRHNGNFFSPQLAIKSLKELFKVLGIKDEDLNEFRVVNLEFGINVIPDYDSREIVKLASFYLRKRLLVEDFEYSKISDTSKAKQFKIYHKGVQFPEFIEVHPNTLRLEYRLKNNRGLAKVLISTAEDLLKIEKFGKLFEQLLKDFEKIFFCDSPEVFQKIAVNQTKESRNNWGKSKEEYLKNNPHISALKTHIKSQIIDTFLLMSENAITPQRTPINTENYEVVEVSHNRINDVTAQIMSFCKVTKLEISMQKCSSLFLSFTGLHYLLRNDMKTYKVIESKFLSDRMKSESLEKQIDNIAHNIRNSASNKIHNYAKFKERNYHPNQLQFNFI